MPADVPGGFGALVVGAESSVAGLENSHSGRVMRSAPTRITTCPMVKVACGAFDDGEPKGVTFFPFVTTSRRQPL